MTGFGKAYRAKPATAGFPHFAVGSAARGTDPLEESLCHPAPHLGPGPASCRLFPQEVLQSFPPDDDPAI